MKTEVIKLKLSDCFETPDDSGEFEWTATMININRGHNEKIFQKCKVLEEYSIFIEKIKEYNNKTESFTAAVNKAVDDCIGNNVLKNLLETQKKEAMDLVLTEFDEEKYRELMKEEWREEGLKEGLKKGLEEGAFETLVSLVKDGLIVLDEAAKRVGMSPLDFKKKANI